MPPIPENHLDPAEPGQLLNELERRQDDALRQLDQLEEQLNEVLSGLGVTMPDQDDEAVA